MSERESFQIELRGTFGHYKAQCVVENGGPTIRASFGARTIVAGPAAAVTEGKARLERRRMIDAHESKRKNP